MKKKTKNPVQTGTGLVCLRTAATLVLLCTFVLITLRTDAIYYRKTVKGPRNTVSGPRTVDRSKIQPAGDPHVVGELGRDNEGNVIVRWPPWTNGGNIFWEETLKLGQYKNVADFLKVYLE